MNNLTTRQIVFGLLMTLVLAFGVQGIAEALTLTETPPIAQSKRLGSTFDISFSVGLTGNRVAYHSTYSNRRVNANDPTEYIDSSGYLVTYIGVTSRSYRNTTGSAESQLTGGTFVVGSQPSYIDELNQARNAGTPYLVDTSTTGNLYDQNGEAIYIRTGTGTRFDDRDNTNPDDDVAANLYRYTRATFNTTTGISTAPKMTDDSDLHDYNDEAIGITFPKEAGTIRLKNPSFIFGSLPTPSDLGASYTYNKTEGASLTERVRIGLPSSITLVCEEAMVGTHNIVIWDATHDNDFPIGGVPDVRQPRQSITFTLHVTPATTTIEDMVDKIEPDIQRIAVEDAVEPVYVGPGDHLTFTGENNRIRYEVVRGSGTLYVGTFEEEHTVPSTVITVHQSSNVYLNTNNGSNEVHVWFSGEDRSAPRATIIFEYRGQPVPTTRTAPPPQPTQQTPRLTISTSGEGTTRTVTVNAITAAGTSFPGVLVTLSSTDFSLSQAVTTGTPITVTLPTTAGRYTLLATDQSRDISTGKCNSHGRSPTSTRHAFGCGSQCAGERTAND